MFFVAIAIAVSIGLALLVASDAGSLVGLSQDQTAQALPLVIILLLVASAFTRRHKFSEIVYNAGLWVLIFGVAITGYAFRDEIRMVGNRVMGELSPGTAVQSDDGTAVSFRAGIGGSFRLNTEVNGQSIPMIFDTGASAVVLTFEDAQRAGISTDSLRFTIPVQTANGQSLAAAARLKTLNVGGIERQNIRAFVADQGAMDLSLLGMSFLETLSQYSVTGNTLELRN